VGTKVNDLLYDGIEGWKFTPPFGRDMNPLCGTIQDGTFSTFPHLR
jgi:hypothetical protein